MPTIPDKTALGARPSTRLPRGPNRVPGNLNRPTKAAGKLANASLDAVDKISANIKARDEAERKEQAGLELAKADAHWKRNALEAERSFDTDPDHASYDMRWGMTSQDIRNDASGFISDPKVRAKWLAKAEIESERHRERILNRGLNLRKQENLVSLEQSLKGYRAAYAAPSQSDEDRQQTLADINGAIELNTKTGLLDPVAAARLRETYVEGAVADDAELRLYDDPEGLYRDLTGDGTGVSQSGIQMIKKFEGYTKDAKWDVRQYSSGWGTKGKPGEKLSRAEAERRLVKELGEVAGWLEDNITTDLTQNQKDSLISFGFNLGVDDLDRLKGDINAGRFEKVAKRMESFNKVLNEKTGKLEYSRGVHNRRIKEAKLFLDPNDPDGGTAVGRYRNLSPNKRSALLNRLRVSQRAIVNDEIDSAIERARDTGDLAGADQVMSKVRLYMTPNQINAKTLALEEAAAEWKATASLEDMTEDQAGEHLDSLEPKKNADQLSYKRQSRVQDKATRRWNKIRRLREEDPALAVENAPEVKAAKQAVLDKEDMSADQKQRILFESRLEAQRRLGIPEWELSPITQREADELLQMPPLSRYSGDQRAYREKLEQAAERSVQLYGPTYGRMALEKALEWHGRPSEEQAYEQRRALRDKISEEDVYRKSLETAAGDALNRISGGVDGLVKEEPDPKPETPEPKEIDPKKKARFSTAIKDNKTRRALLDLAKRSPKKAQSVLDARFYPGAYSDLMAMETEATQKQIEKN